jgi:hypothetical protein
MIECSDWPQESFQLFVLAMEVRQSVILDAACFGEEWLAHDENAGSGQSRHPLSDRLKICVGHKVVIAAAVAAEEARFADAE